MGFVLGRSFLFITIELVHRRLEATWLPPAAGHTSLFSVSHYSSLPNYPLISVSRHPAWVPRASPPCPGCQQICSRTDGFPEAGQTSATAQPVLGDVYICAHALPGLKHGLEVRFSLNSQALGLWQQRSWPKWTALTGPQKQEQPLNQSHTRDALSDGLPLTTEMFLLCTAHHRSHFSPVAAECGYCNKEPNLFLIVAKHT